MTRGRPRLVERKIDVHVYIPEGLYNQLTILLWSDLERRVPYGHLSNFAVDRMKEWLGTQALDVGEFVGQAAGTCFVRGDAEVLKQLEMKLKMKGTES